MHTLSKLIVHSDEFISLWKEYEEGITDEARFVKQIDKLEMIIQAHEYEKG